MLAAYRGIINEVSPEKLGLSGLSAGASLVLTMTLKAGVRRSPNAWSTRMFHACYRPQCHGRQL